MVVVRAPLLEAPLDPEGEYEALLYFKGDFRDTLIYVS